MRLYSPSSGKRPNGRLLASDLNATITFFSLGDSAIGSAAILPGIGEDLLEIVKNNISLVAGYEYIGMTLDLNIGVQVVLYSHLDIISVD